MYDLSHLDALEADAIYIIRELTTECENLVMLYPIGKDPSVMLHLAAAEEMRKNPEPKRGYFLSVTPTTHGIRRTSVPKCGSCLIQISIKAKASEYFLFPIGRKRISGSDFIGCIPGSSCSDKKVCKAPKRLLVAPGAAHGMSFYVESEKYGEELKKFWRDFDQNIWHTSEVIL